MQSMNAQISMNVQLAQIPVMPMPAVQTLKATMSVNVSQVLLVTVNSVKPVQQELFRTSLARKIVWTAPQDTTRIKRLRQNVLPVQKDGPPILKASLNVQPVIPAISLIQRVLWNVLNVKWVRILM